MLPLFERYHAYKSLSRAITYGFVLVEDDNVVAGFAWQPPPPGAAKAVCPGAPYGVLSLSRMVAVPADERRVRLRNPLRKQMRLLIDRGRWPVLVTYSDEGLGHDGYIYKITGWTKTARNTRPFTEDENGARLSAYSNGRRGSRPLQNAGETTIQRWEHRVVAEGAEASWIMGHGWERVAIPGKVWASGNQAHEFVQKQRPR